MAERPIRFSAERPWQENGQTVNRPWHGEYEGHERIDGVEIPLIARVAWTLPEGEYEYFRVRLSNVRFLQ